MRRGPAACLRKGSVKRMVLRAALRCIVMIMHGDDEYISMMTKMGLFGCCC